VAWHIGNVLHLINKVTLRRARLVLRWATAYGRWTTLEQSQPARSTQPSTLCGMVKWALAFGVS